MDNKTIQCCTLQLSNTSSISMYFTHMKAYAISDMLHALKWQPRLLLPHQWKTMYAEPTCWNSNIKQYKPIALNHRNLRRIFILFLNFNLTLSYFYMKANLVTKKKVIDFLPYDLIIQSGEEKPKILKAHQFTVKYDLCATWVSVICIFPGVYLSVCIFYIFICECPPYQVFTVCRIHINFWGMLLELIWDWMCGSKQGASVRACVHMRVCALESSSHT